MPVLLQLGQDRHQRQLDVVDQPADLHGGQLLAQLDGQLPHRLGPQAPVGPGLVLAGGVQGQLGALPGRPLVGPRPPRAAAPCAGSAGPGRPGRRSAGRAGPGRRPGRCPWPAPPAPSRGPRRPGTGTWRRGPAWAAPGRPAAPPAPPGPPARPRPPGRARPRRPPLGPQAGAGQLGPAGAGAQAGGQGDRPAGGHRGQPGGQLALGQPAGVDLEPGVDRAGLDRGREQPLAQRVELQGVEQPVDLGPVPGPHAQVAGPDGQGHVVAQPHQLLVAEHVVAVGEQVLLELAPLLVGVGHDLLGGAVGLDQLGGRLVADPGDPGQVVGGVAAQGGHVDVAPGRHAVALLDGGLVVDGGVGDAAPGHHHPDLGLVVDQLEVVPVPGDDQHRQRLLPGLLDQGGDQVVGLVAGDLDHRDAQGGQHLADQRHLGAEVVGGGPAVGLVAVVDVVAVGGPAQVEADRDPVRREVAEQLDQHGGEAVDDVGQLPGGRLQVAGQGEEGPVGEAVPVQQDQRGRGGRFGGGHAAESINRPRRGRPGCPPWR